jgi:predicted DNA-binding antitoxin AbrB/MazE fold protein
MEVSEREVWEIENNMNQTIKAVYENGYFKPLEPLKNRIEEGQIVKLTITIIEEFEQSKTPNEEKNQD